jgi:plastocyanin
MKKLLILAALALAAIALVACGDDEESTTPAAEETTAAETTSADEPAGGGGTLAVSAVPDGSFAFTESELTAPAGPTTVEFDNPSTTPHNVYIEDESGEIVAESETVTETSTTTDAELEAGTYTYFCDIPGHREGGMEGTLTVE